MKKLLFVIVFVSVIFFGYQFLTEQFLEPSNETNMNEKEQQEYLDSFGVMDENIQNETTMLSFEQCMEMSYAYKTYSCVSGMVGNDTTTLVNMDVVKTENVDETGKNIYNLFANNKAIIDMKVVLNKTETDTDKGLYVYEGTFDLLQDSEHPLYWITVKDGEIIRIEKKGA
ncbi:hypothetical protein MHH81_20685 [Psychrobacillus sp. FSL H8-0484]|uniref:hypothetical protein n=1 Tax=Psychrobacillus sp. FSL H8-0484 TaxID=2921390 RepID=UPI0030F9ED80